MGIHLQMCNVFTSDHKVSLSENAYNPGCFRCRPEITVQQYWPSLPYFIKQYGGDFIVNMYFFIHFCGTCLLHCPSLKVSLVLHPIDHAEVKPVKCLVVLGFIEIKSYRKSFIFPFNNICRKKEKKKQKV